MYYSLLGGYMIVNYTFFYHGLASSNHFTIATRFEIHANGFNNELNESGKDVFLQMSVCEDKLRGIFLDLHTYRKNRVVSSLKGNDRWDIILIFSPSNRDRLFTIGILSNLVYDINLLIHNRLKCNRTFLPVSILYRIVEKSFIIE